MKRILLLIILFYLNNQAIKAQWTKINLPSNYEVKQMQFVNDSVGFIIADSIVGLYLTGKIYKTTDGGLNWFEKNFFYQSFDYMHFINQDTGWICMSNGGIGTIRRTTDGGNTFINISNNAPYGPIYFVSNTTGYIGWIGATSQGAVLYKTTDGGFTWNSTGINLGLSGLQDLVFADSVTGFLGGLYGPTLGKIDLVNSFYDSFSTDLAVLDIDYEMNSNQLFFTGEQFGVNSGLYKTSSSGNLIDLVLDYNIFSFVATSVKCKNANEIISGGQQGDIAFSRDGGNNWDFENTGSQTTFIDVYWGTDFAIATGGDGDLYRRSVPLTIEESTTNKNFSLFPNPAENMLYIKSITREPIIVAIYDVLQKKVLEKNNSNCTLCSVEISKLSKGFYIVKLSNINGELTNVRQLIIK